MKLRLHLLFLVVGVLVPMLLFALLALRLLIQDEREAVERDAIGRARAAMIAVDAHLRASIVSLETLAASKSLEADDIAAFHAESQRVLRAQPAWVNIGLVTPAKVQLSDAVYAFGKPAPFSVDDESFAAAVRGERAGIGGVVGGSAVRSPTVRVRVPVTHGGQVRYVLSAPLNLQYLAEVLEAQHLPDGWAIGVVDREKRFIVRTPRVAAGSPVSANFAEAIAREPQGWFQGRTIEGRSTYTSYVTSPLSGWVLGIAIPAGIVEAGARRAFVLLGAGALLACAIGALLAWQIARRAETPASR